MTSIFKALLGFAIVLTLTLQVASAQTPAAPAKKKKKAAQTKEAPANATKKATPPSAALKEIEPAGAKITPGETLNFRIEDTTVAPTNDPVFKFKEGGDNTPPPTSPASFSGAVDDDVPFRTFIGYPKHKFSALVVPKNVAATWSLNGTDFNFRSNALGYGVGYELVASPRLQIGLEFVHSEMKMDQARVGTGANARDFLSSKATYDVYLAKMRYCFFGSSNFFQQFCPGLDIGNDSYPVLSFVTGTNLKLDHLQDIVAGLNLTYQSPITDKILFRSTIGYNYGLGIGSSGTVTSKGNSSYYLKLGAGWDINDHHGIGVDVFWHNRNAKMADKTNAVNDEWTTKATELGARLAYTYTL